MDFTERSVVPAPRKVQTTRVVGGICFNVLTESEVVQHVVSESQAGRGGSVVTPNIDICRQVRRDPAALSLIANASLIVPDGMPLLWAAKVRGEPFPGRVTGSSLIFTLTEAAAFAGLSVYFLGGAPGVPEAAAENLSRRYPRLKVAGTDSPAVGFDKSMAGMDAVCSRVRDAAPSIVYVGLGFPKQERVIAGLTSSLPAAWFVGCGAAIPFAAGAVARAPVWMQRSGLEWAHRLIMEPRRLFRRYLVHDLPFAARLMITAAAERAKTG
jgi:N-acetylglucosaminyldiphosphoundecaprenol N-acetyl-beta-D-mannosaminyltransferase